MPLRSISKGHMIFRGKGNLAQMPFVVSYHQGLKFEKKRSLKTVYHSCKFSSETLQQMFLMPGGEKSFKKELMDCARAAEGAEQEEPTRVAEKEL